MRDDTASKNLAQIVAEEHSRVHVSWHKTHINIMLGFSIFIVLAEIGMYFILDAQNLIIEKDSPYYIHYILIPAAFYFILNLTARIFLHIHALSDRTKDFIVSIAFSALCLGVCYFHDYFIGVYCGGMAVITLTTIYGDRILTTIVTVVTLIGETLISVYGRWDASTVRDSRYLLNVSFVLLIILCCYAINISIVSWEEKSLTNIIERQQEVEHYKLAASHDALTGIQNRRGLRTYLDDVEPPVIIVMMDIDRFKSVNDRWGHQTGDDVLIGFGKILASHENENITAFRAGGDEFMLCLTESTQKDAEQLCRQIKEEFCKFLPQDILAAGISFSYGISIFRKNALPSDAIHKADEALYAAKPAGKI